MLDLYESTSLSKIKVAKQTGFLDWNMQPCIFKSYPSSLFSYSLSQTPALRLLHLARSVTYEQKIAGKPYKRLSTPSAGNLHPLEMYVQIRGVKGILSGIYHLDSDEDKLVLVADIETDGIESRLGMTRRFKGMIIMVSIVPFRSIWKYKDRAIRYCYLDLGHQLAALNVASTLTQQKLTFLSDYDNVGLSGDMGFDEQEYIASVALYGEETSKEAKPLKEALIQVQPTNFYQRYPIQEKILQSHQNLSEFTALQENKDLLDYVFKRRSAREFALQSLKKEQVEQIMQFLLQLPKCINCYLVLLRSEFYKPGLYRGTTLVCEGVYVSDVVKYLVQQRFVFNSSLVLVLSSSEFNAKVLTQASYEAHMLGSKIHNMGLGMSGVGAFYDEDLKAFLKTDENILYTLAIGHET